MKTITIDVSDRLRREFEEYAQEVDRPSPQGQLFKEALAGD